MARLAVFDLGLKGLLRNSGAFLLDPLREKTIARIAAGNTKRMLMTFIIRPSLLCSLL